MSLFLYQLLKHNVAHMYVFKILQSNLDYIHKSKNIQLLLAFHIITYKVNEHMRKL